MMIRSFSGFIKLIPAYAIVFLLASCSASKSSLGSPTDTFALTYTYFDSSIAVQWPVSANTKNAGYDVYISGVKKVYLPSTETDADGNSVVIYETESDGTPAQDTPSKDGLFENGASFDTALCVVPVAPPDQWCKVNPAPVTGTSYRISGLANGHSYYIKVKEIIKDSTTTIDYSDPDPPDFVTLATYPYFSYSTIPTSFMVSTKNSITLSWSAVRDVSTNVATNVYEICESSTETGCSTFSPVYTTGAGKTSYTVSALLPDTTYYFSLREKSSDGTTGATFPSTGPIKISTLESTSTAIAFSWDAPCLRQGNASSTDIQYFPIHKMLYYVDTTSVQHDDPYDYFNDPKVDITSTSIIPGELDAQKQYLQIIVKTDNLQGSTLEWSSTTVDTKTYSYELNASGVTTGANMNFIIQSFDDNNALMGTSRIISVKHP